MNGMRRLVDHVILCDVSEMVVDVNEMNEKVLSGLEYPMNGARVLDCEGVEGA